MKRLALPFALLTLLYAPAAHAQLCTEDALLLGDADLVAAGTGGQLGLCVAIPGNANSFCDWYVQVDGAGIDGGTGCQRIGSAAFGGTGDDIPTTANTLRTLIDMESCGLDSCAGGDCNEDILPPAWESHDPADELDVCEADMVLIDDDYIHSCTANVDEYMSTDPNIASRILYARREGANEMDYQVCLIEGGFDWGVIGDKVYNLQDAGNWLWGCGMAKLQIPLTISRLGAHYNDFRRGCAQNEFTNPLDGCRFGLHWPLDSPIDQAAIVEGYTYCAEQLGTEIPPLP